MAATGLQYLNGLDLFTTYGVIVERGNGEMLLFPKRKDSLSNDWQEENGLDIDLSNPRVEAKEVKFRCALIAADFTQWWARRNAFFAELIKPGWHTWRVDDHEKNYSIYYLGTGNPRVTSGKIKDLNGPIFEFDLELMVSDDVIVNPPAPSSEPVIIKDQNGNTIAIIPPGQTYTIESTDVYFNGDYMSTVPPGYKLMATSPYSLQFDIQL